MPVQVCGSASCFRERWIYPPAGRNRRIGQGKQLTKGDASFIFALDKPLKALTAWQVQKIDDALAELGPFAEVRLVKNRGKLRFIRKVESESMPAP